MTFPNNFEDKIGFSSIRNMLKERCLSEMGQNHVNNIVFQTNFQDLSISLKQTDEFRQILLFDNGFPSQDYIDMHPVLSTLRIQGTFIEQENLFELKISLSTIVLALDFFQEQKKGEYPTLELFCEDIFINKNILKKIDSIIDEKGLIRDNASERLQEIRKEKAAKERSILVKIKHALIVSKEHGYTEENVESTVRDGRLVIPVLTAYKRNIPGFIHDESSSGRITYIEPTEAFNLNNDIRDLINAEKREIIKILTLFTEMLRPEIDMLIKAYHFLGIMDFIRAKASFAITVGGIKPDFQENPVIDWHDAVHPLLYLLHNKQHKPVVPLTISLNQEERILVISGPNAGGKSICLKTVGLLQYMWQCGLLVPMKENSIIGIFHHIFIDIGDQQSLENDLSTYSSHLLNMKFFMEKANPQSIFFIDEFGSGTEPNIGGAIAESVLEELNRKKAFGIVTTHYANLKLLSEHNKGIINGAMLFDMKELKPTFKLRIGKPGSSFAFEIAKKIGFPQQILSSAKEKSGPERANFDQQLQQLEIEKDKIEQEQRRLTVVDEFLNEMIIKYNKLNTHLEQSRKEILNNAKTEAKQILDNSNKLIEKAIREIKESHAEKETTKKLRQEIVDYKEKIAKDPIIQNIQEPLPKSSVIKKQEKHQKEKPAASQQKEKIEFTIDTTPIHVNDYVRLQGSTTVGRVTKVKGKQVLVAFDSVSMRLETSLLEKIKGYKPEKRVSNNYSGVMKEINNRKAQFSLTLDLRGIRSDDALQMVEKYIDEAALLSVKQVRILHGKGNGILRTLIRGLLGKNSLVERFDDEFIESGGTGITVVSLK